jgi:16S rRNA processing protein RimM
VVPPRRSAPRICVAQIGAPHGVRGEVRIKSFTADPMALADYGVLSTEDGARAFEIAALRPAKDVLVARLAGIANRDAAESLRNTRLYVPRDRLPAAEEDEFYHADLVGLAAVSTDGTAIGTVAALHNFGAGDLIEVAPAEGGPSLLLPFTKEGVPTVDIAGGRIVIDPPADAAADEPSSRVALSYKERGK